MIKFDFKSRIKAETIIISYHLFTNIIMFMLILVLPMKFASAIGLVILLSYFFLGYFIRKNYLRSPNFFTLPLVYMLINLFFIAITSILHINILLPISLMFSYIAVPAYLVSRIPHELKYYIVLWSLGPIYFLPVILLKLGSFFSAKGPNCLNKLSRVIGKIASHWKVMIIASCLCIIMVIPLSTINFLYEYNVSSFGVDVYSYSISYDKSFTEIHDPLTDVRHYQKKTGKLTYLKYMVSSSNVIFEIPLNMIIYCRGNKPNTLYEGASYKVVTWAWREFTFYLY